mmetsp:Transcript_20151/g.29903  ORF Transcript_20151/g.29903 Transcript_20151/m.29903 type:complete len:170 (-) Transcript_20151:167-676(-)
MWSCRSYRSQPFDFAVCYYGAVRSSQHERDLPFPPARIPHTFTSSNTGARKQTRKYPFANLLLLPLGLSPSPTIRVLHDGAAHHHSFVGVDRGVLLPSSYIRSTKCLSPITPKLDSQVRIVVLETRRESSKISSTKRQKGMLSTATKQASSSTLERSRRSYQRQRRDIV